MINGILANRSSQSRPAGCERETLSRWEDWYREEGELRRDRVDRRDNSIDNRWATEFDRTSTSHDEEEETGRIICPMIDSHWVRREHRFAGSGNSKNSKAVPSQRGERESARGRGRKKREKGHAEDARKGRGDATCGWSTAIESGSRRQTRRDREWRINLSASRQECGRNAEEERTRLHATRRGMPQSRFRCEFNTRGTDRFADRPPWRAEPPSSIGGSLKTRAFHSSELRDRRGSNDALLSYRHPLIDTELLSRRGLSSQLRSRHALEARTGDKEDEISDLTLTDSLRLNPDGRGTAINSSRRVGRHLD